MLLARLLTNWIRHLSWIMIMMSTNVQTGYRRHAPHATCCDCLIIFFALLRSDLLQDRKRKLKLEQRIWADYRLLPNCFVLLHVAGSVLSWSNAMFRPAFVMIAPILIWLTQLIMGHTGEQTTCQGGGGPHVLWWDGNYDQCYQFQSVYTRSVSERPRVPAPASAQSSLDAAMVMLCSN